MSEVAVFLNPLAHKNRRLSSGHVRYLQRVLGPAGLVYETHSLAQLRTAVQRSVARGSSYYVADGGDGSLNYLLNELRTELGRQGKSPDLLPPVTPTNSGAIDFVARKARIKSDTASILRRLRELVSSGREPATVSVKSLRLQGIQRQGQDAREFDRLGFALAAGGVGQRFFEKYLSLEPGPRTIVRVVGTGVSSYVAQQLRLPVPESWFRYGQEFFARTSARVNIDGRPVADTEHGAIHAGAFDVSLGGVFHVFPLAQQPGTIHFQAGAITAWELIKALPDLHRGRAVRGKSFVEVGGSEMKVESLGAELLQPIVDGELISDVTSLRVRSGPPIPILRVDD